MTNMTKILHFLILILFQNRVLIGPLMYISAITVVVSPRTGLSRGAAAASTTLAVP